ncbi:MAG: VWA domain-containing protein, partial [Planctomycetota bacterium]
MPPRPKDRPGLRAERRPEDALPISLLLVIDRSGSMTGAKLTMAIEGARRAAATLSRVDRVGVITFADDATLDIPPTSARRLGNLGWRLAGLEAGGNTDIYGALVRAREVLEKEPAPIRHLILLTDGRQTARRAVFGHLVEGMARAGITLTAIGLGYSHDEQLLKSIAMWAPRGRYVPVDSEAQLPTIITRDTQIVAAARREEAEAKARIQDRRRPPEAPEAEPPAPAKPPGSGEPDEPPSPPTPTPGEDLAPLRLLRPHEATRGLDEKTLPRVGPARRADVRPGAALLVARGEDQAALAASRWGLGRVLVWALPPDARGLAPWREGLGRLLTQAVRSVRAPEGVGRVGPLASVIAGPEGEHLRLDAAPGAPPPAVRVGWEGPDGVLRDLGRHVPGTDDTDLTLPSAPPGTRAVVHLTLADRGLSLPTLTYLVPSPRAREVPQAGDAEALRALLGAKALASDPPLFAPGRAEP